MSLQLIDRFHPHLRNEQQAAIDAGHLRKRDEIELLSPQHIGSVALLSLLMFVGGSLFFAALNIAAYFARTHATIGRIDGWGLVLWIAINIISSVIIILVHEAIHGMAFTFWGGKPHYGAKLPYAFYCGARNQIFRRNHYLVVGLAPLVVITIAGIVFTLLVPALASYVILASIANFSGAAGDVWAVARLLRQPRHVLVEDTETGCRVWEIGGAGLF